ncbi:hypothetical protein [Curtobacterium sp. ISL-83]|nr:hypothetical protein [Curtobacterium sp. ISL-83]MBT2504019.1 hypothetical protein [Curtobacterium sp. ISL-83]
MSAGLPEAGHRQVLRSPGAAATGGASTPAGPSDEPSYADFLGEQV